MTDTDKPRVLPELPQLDGFTFRPFRGPSDFAPMAAVITASGAADNVVRGDTAETLASDYAHLFHSDPYQDMLFAEMDGQVVAFNRCWWSQEENGPLLYKHIGYSHPASRGRGLGRTALHWMEARLRQIAVGHAAEGERFFQAFAADSEKARLALLHSAGYTQVRYGFDMNRPLSEPVEVTPLPPGLEVRPVQPEHYRAIFDAGVEAFRDHWGYVAPDEGSFASWQAHLSFQPHLWQVAWNIANNEVAGMVQNFVNEPENQRYNRRRGYTEGISVRRPYRRLGLARALLTRSLKQFQSAGFTEAALGVDAENPTGALRLYESVGFIVEQRGAVYRKPLR